MKIPNHVILTRCALYSDSLLDAMQMHSVSAYENSESCDFDTVCRAVVQDPTSTDVYLVEQPKEHWAAGSVDQSPG